MISPYNSSSATIKNTAMSDIKSLVFEPKQINFGNIISGGNEGTQTFKIKNIGIKTVKILDVYFEELDEFELIGNIPSLLKTGEEFQLTINHISNSTNLFTNNIIVETTEENSPHILNITGRVIGNVIENVGTFLEAKEATIPIGLKRIYTIGREQYNDNGGAFYLRWNDTLDVLDSSQENFSWFEGVDGSYWFLESNQIYTPEMFGALGGSTQNNQIAINKALLAPMVNKLLLSANNYFIGASIVIPSGKTLTGLGRDVSIISIQNNYNYSANNTAVHVDPASKNVCLSDFKIDVRKVNLGLGIPTRICATGIGGTNFSLERVDVWNASGYGHWSNGGTSLTPASGLLIDCRSYNCQIAFEQNHCDGVTLIDCRALPGDSDIPCESFFHPLFGANNIIHIGCSAKGMAGGGIVPALNTNLDNIQFINCDIEMTNSASALIIETLGTGNRITGLRFLSTRLHSATGEAVILHNVTDVLFTQCDIKGAVGITANSTASARLTDCDVVGSTDPSGASTAVGLLIYPGASITTIGGTLTANGPIAEELPVSGSGVAKLDPMTVVSPSNFTGYVIRDQFLQVSNIANIGGTSFGNLAGAFIGATDTVGDVTRVSLQGATGSQVYLESVIEASSYATFKLRIRDAGSMTERLSITSGGLATFTGNWTVVGELAVNVPAANAGFVRYKVGGVNKAYICIGGNAKTMFYNSEDVTGDHSFQLAGVVKAQVLTNGINIPIGSTYKINGTQVINAQGAAIADAAVSIAAPTKIEFDALVTKFNTLLARIRTHGLIAT